MVDTIKDSHPEVSHVGLKLPEDAEDVHETEACLTQKQILQITAASRLSRLSGLSRLC
jgi:hypothetical protein